ncbi:MAG: Holliday junction resolvase RuvX [Methylophilaceae bacterium 17-44-8]|nr:MAG: Holliday junction resolvase RuvX [Methylophilales bacterium 28-44-11]OZA05897.1 MAG: Holliday junction resolvase RuvX [Methylophilaceae bacterium 17-44-8]
MHNRHQPLSQSHLPIAERTYPEIEGTVLGFDFGEKRIGIAVGETMLKLAHPLTTIHAEENTIKFTQIEALIQEWRPRLLVVGLPMHMDGEAHLLTQLAKKFAQRLEGRFNLPVVMIDERLTSEEASQSLRDSGIHGFQQKAMIDQVAAQTILQSYFDNVSTKTI